MASGNEFGCDIDQMAALGDLFKKAQQQIQEIVGDLTTCYKGLAWEGPDAESFNSDLAGSKLQSTLEQATTCLDAKRASVEDNRQKQIEISSK